MLDLIGHTTSRSQQTEPTYPLLKPSNIECSSAETEQTPLLSELIKSEQRSSATSLVMASATQQNDKEEEIHTPENDALKLAESAEVLPNHELNLRCFQDPRSTTVSAAAGDVVRSTARSDLLTTTDSGDTCNSAIQDPIIQPVSGGFMRKSSLAFAAFFRPFSPADRHIVSSVYVQ